MKHWNFLFPVPNTTKLRTKTADSLLIDAAKPTLAQQVNKALSQNQLVVLFGLTWMLGMLVVTIFLTQFS